MGIVYIVQLTLIGVVAVATGFRVRALRTRPTHPGTRALALGLLAIDCGLTLGYPPFYWYAFRLLGHVPALPQLFQYAATIAAAYQMQLFALSVVYSASEVEAMRHRVRLRRRWLLGALAALVACYLVGPLRAGIPVVPAHGIRDPGVAAYVLVLQGYGGIAVLDILRICWSSRNTERPYLRVGLRLTAIGCAFAVLYSLHKIVYFAVAATGRSLPWAENGTAGIQLLFLAPALICVCGGITVPFLGPRISRWWRRRTDHRNLGTLSATLSATGAAGPVPSRLRGRRARLLSRVISIRDYLVGPLRPYLDADVHEAAYQRAIDDGTAVDEARIAAEAACIGAALQHRQSGQAPRNNPPTLHYGAELDAEAAWLARVGQALRSARPSPLLPDHRMSRRRGPRR